MSGIIDSVKSAVGAQQEFPGPKSFKAETQVDRNVGIEADIKGPQPIYEQETDNGLKPYKGAEKMVGKNTIITGGDSGIGRAAADCYAAEGANVAIIYLPEEEKDAQETKRMVEARGTKCLLIPQDIREEEGCKRAIDLVLKEFGSIDVLVNNASVMYNQDSITDITTEQFDRTMKTNIYGTFFLTRAVVPHLKKGSSIIITTSQVAYAGPPSLIDYSMTKAAQRGLIYSLSNQLIGKGIRVNGVAPGPVWTPLQPAAMDSKTMGEWHASPAPIGRIGQPSELGPAYVFLASSDGSFVSGQVIHCNGGAVING